MIFLFKHNRNIAYLSETIKKMMNFLIKKKDSKILVVKIFNFSEKVDLVKSITLNIRMNNMLLNFTKILISKTKFLHWSNMKIRLKIFKLK